MATYMLISIADFKYNIDTYFDKNTLYNHWHQSKIMCGFWGNIFVNPTPVNETVYNNNFNIKLKS